MDDIKYSVRKSGFFKSSHSIVAVVGVISLGLATMVLPIAKAGPNFHVNRYRGKFKELQGQQPPMVSVSYN